MEKITSLYKIDKEKEKRLWDNGIFIFDTSALLDLYTIPKSKRENIYNGIFDKIKDRLWIPAHVKDEFDKKNKEVMFSPINKVYNELKKEISKITDKEIQKIIKRITKDDFYPHFDEKNVIKLKEVFENIKPIKEGILKDIETAEQEIKDCEKDDDVLQSINNFFDIGARFSFQEKIEIIKEGKVRYEFKIPPGYEDKKDKVGFQIFGDLFIWKEILNYSKEQKKPIIFITIDVKEDWCISEGKDREEKRITSPRHELIKEIYDFSNVEFWMYSLPQFLYHSNNYLKSNIENETIEELKSPEEVLSFRCNDCNEIHTYYKENLNLDFECVGSDERNMGTENHYQAEDYFQCECGNDIEVTYEIWEYPIGTHSCDNIEIDGGTLIESFKPTIDFFTEEEDFVRCLECD